jgi:hypothetical protein
MMRISVFLKAAIFLHSILVKEDIMYRSKALLVILLAALILGACDGTGPSEVEIAEEIMATEGPTNTPVPPTAEPTATEEPVMMPVSMVSAALGEGEFNQYKISLPGMAPLSFEENELPAPPGSVTANWYTSGGYYVVAYYGLDLEASGPLCPGNSILTGSGWEYVTNAPTEAGACEGFPTLTEDPEVGPVVCHGTLFYRTAIPSDQQGTLFGTLEKLDADGNMVGITSQVQSTAEMLEIDLDELCQ